ncbi:zinc finger protein [Macleaya cordata]|uniref:Zinc finger protein n=1 Tax=Macleaya cordata TaxID=56857 RepID=A0A200QCY3_MACCD|nr:zinc finger protein [Macleaya cordata]
MFLIYLSNYLCLRSKRDDDDDDGVVAHASDTIIVDIHSISSPSTVLTDDEDGEDDDENNHSGVHLLDTLPLFSFDSVTGLPSYASVDCAICLSKFKPHDQLRLLPSCCHAFHSQCIDSWLFHNLTCPLCRCAVEFVADAESSINSHLKLSSRQGSNSSSRSFWLEIGSINLSRRHQRSESNITTTNDEQSRYYSIGSDFEYVVGDIESEVVVEVTETTHHRPDEISVSVEDEQMLPPVQETLV